MSSRKARELGTLRPTLDWPSAFSPWSQTGCPVWQEPTTTFQSSNGCTVLRPSKSTRRLTTFSKIAVCQVTVTRLPSRPTHHRTFTLDKAPIPSDWWLLLAANLEPLPPSHCLHSLSGITARRRCVNTCLNSTDRRPLHRHPLRDAC